MRLFIADDLPPQCVDELRALGLEVTHEPKCSAEELPARIGDASILVVRSKKVTRAAIERAARLALITPTMLRTGPPRAKDRRAAARVDRHPTPA